MTTLGAYGTCPVCQSVVVVDVETVGPLSTTVCAPCFEPLILGPSTGPRGAAWRAMTRDERDTHRWEILRHWAHACRAVVYA